MSQLIGRQHGQIRSTQNMKERSKQATKKNAQNRFLLCLKKSFRMKVQVTEANRHIRIRRHQNKLGNLIWAKTPNVQMHSDDGIINICNLCCWYFCHQRQFNSISFSLFFSFAQCQASHTHHSSVIIMDTILFFGYCIVFFFRCNVWGRYFIFSPWYFQRICSTLIFEVDFSGLFIVRMSVQPAAYWHFTFAWILLSISTNLLVIVNNTTFWG